MRVFDLVGQQFGRWTVIARGKNTVQGQAQWLCRCACGKTKTIKSIVIRRGLSQSCGCLKLEVTIARSTKHGHATNGITPTYHSWSGMVARCTNPKNSRFHSYGGRGITVCDRWLTFAGFLADMGVKPVGKSIDRIDNDKGYSPENCRWATCQEQQRNKRAKQSLTLPQNRQSPP